MQKIRGFLWTYRAFLWAALGVGCFFSLLSALSGLYPETTRVVVLGRSKPAGTVVEAGDVQAREVPTSFIPAGTESDSAFFVGKTLATAGVEGQILSAAHVVGTRFLENIEPGHAIVPITVKDSGLSTFFEPGIRLKVLLPAENTAVPADPSDASAPASNLLSDQAVLVGKEVKEKTSGIFDGDTAMLTLYISVPSDQAPGMIAASTRAHLVVLPSL